MAVQLSLVSQFDHQVTGVAVSETGRIFVNFPRWTEDAPVSVAEVIDGGVRPYPDERWNEWRNARKNELTPNDHFVCVQSVVCDGRGSLWVLDPAAPAQQQVVQGGPKLVRIDLSSDQVVHTISFGPELAPQGSYLNDVRFHPNGRTAYITDSGAKGALLVVDLESGEARRVLDGHPSTQPEKDVVVKVDGKELRRADGKGVEFAADSIEITPDGAYVVYQALTGRTVYRVSTEALDNEGLTPDALGARVETLAKIGVSDGYWMDREGRLFLSAVEENAVKVREPSGEVRTFIQDERLRWPDSFGQGPDGTIYVTTSHIQDCMWFNPEAGPAIRTELWRAEEHAS
jgi:sugar lactone lactonase YvrE